jgi:hypothetical protein
MTSFKPQPSLRPILNLKPDGRRVKFLARTPTWPRGKNSNNNNNNTANNSNDASPAPAAISLSPTEEMRVVDREATGESGTDELQQPSLSFASAATPLSEYGSRTEPEQKSESAEQQPEEEVTSPPLGIAPSPVPSRSPSGRSHSPTPSHATSNHSSSPRPSRSTRMRMPTRLPDPPAAPLIPIRIARAHHTRPSASTPSGSRVSSSPSRSSATGPHRHVPETPGTPPRSTSPVTVPAVSPAAVAGPSTIPSPPPIPLSALAWSSSPLRNSVLPSDRPVVMPRAKKVDPTSPASESRPSSPTSTWGDAPTLPSYASQVSVGSREPSARRGYPDSLSHGKLPTEMAGGNARQASMSSHRHGTPSAYSNDDGDWVHQAETKE